MRIPFKETYNLRDLGQIPISLGRYTKNKQFIRSDNLNLYPEEISYLRDYGVKVILDLRSETEVLRQPNQLSNNPQFIYHHIPLLNDINNPINYNSITLLDLYIQILETHQKELKEIFSIINNYLDQTILFHCTAGKDRTGILAAFLLAIAGVNEVDIVANYEITYTYLEPKTSELRKNFPDIPVHILNSNPNVMQSMLKYIHEKYGDILYYLKHIGVNNCIIQNIKNKLS